MSNVCYVPLNYLFIRGRIKLFSLCLKEFRDNGFIFPVVKKNVTFEYMTDSYEGRIIRAPYSREEEEDLDEEELKKKRI